jgi:RND family efflux transporter MFP subunit
VVTVAAVVGVAFVLGLWPRLRRRGAVRNDTVELAVPTVAIVRPERGAPTTTIVLPGNAQANLDAPIFSRINGYVERWYVDIGAHVKKGQLLAQIATPEVDEQLQQARDTLASSKANLVVAQATAARFSGLSHTKAVSPQEVDTAVGALRANQATVRANEATVRQLEQLVEFARIRAPFDGIITVRNIDVGDLINSGSSTVPKTELFHIVQDDELRIYVSVPEAYAQLAVPKLHAEVRFTAFPGRVFTATLVRTAKAIDPTTRTLNVELDVDNKSGDLFAGGYAEVRLLVPARTTWILPVETLLFRREGLLVATVVGHTIALVKVTTGRDFGETVQVVDGLRGDEVVVANPPDSIADGQEVRVAAGPPMQARASRP